MQHRETLRQLDKSVEIPGTITSVVIGVIGTLIMGGGMSLVMVGPEAFFVLVYEMMLRGIILGIIGSVLLLLLIPMCLGFKEDRQEVEEC